MDYIRAQAAAHPAQAEALNELGALLEDKLWFQLSAKLLEASAAGHFQQAPRLVELFEGLARPVQDKLKPLHLAQLAVAAARQQPDGAAALAFLEPLGEVLKEDREAAVVVSLAVAEHRLEAGEAAEAGELLEQAGRAMRDHTGIMDGKVQSAYYRMALLFYKARGPATKFFDSAIMYLAHTPVEQIPAAEQKQLASAVGLAALVGQKVYNFGELLQHPVVDVLRGTEFEWLRDLLHAFNAGDIAGYQRIAAAKGATEEVLAKNASFLNQKIRILALMEAVFRRASDDRVITFAEISEACSLQLPEVELLLVKAFSIGVVRGTIDEVSQTVSFSWVQPRVLSLEQVAGMRDRLQNWSGKVNETATLLENNAGDVLSHYK